jgi:hypothetical protein
MLPVGSFAGARWFNVAGALLAVALLIRERMRRGVEAGSTALDPSP